MTWGVGKYLVQDSFLVHQHIYQQSFSLTWNCLSRLFFSLSLATTALMIQPWNSILNSSFIRCAKTQVSLFFIITHKPLLCENNWLLHIHHLSMLKTSNYLSSIRTVVVSCSLCWVFMKTLNLTEFLSSSFTWCGRQGTYLWRESTSSTSLTFFGDCFGYSSSSSVYFWSASSSLQVL